MQLASMALARGRNSEAEALYRENLELQQKVLGPDHQSTLVCGMNLGSALLNQVTAHGACD